MSEMDSASADIEAILRESFAPASPEQWRAEAERALKGMSPVNALHTQTREGISLRPIYHRTDAESLRFPGSLPGQPPFVRGAEAAGHVVAGWQIAQRLPGPTPAAFNTALREALAGGQNTVVLEADLAARATADGTGAAGPHTRVAIAGLADLDRALEGIDIRRYPIVLDAGADTLQLFARFIALCRKRQIDCAAVQGSVIFDPFRELLMGGRLDTSIRTCFDRAAALAQWRAAKAPRFKTLAVQAEIYADAGATAAQDLAFALASGTTCVRELLKRDVPLAVIAPRMRFTFGIGADFFMQIARLRAARLLWSRIIAAFGGDAALQKMSLHGRCCRWNKTRLDPHTNLLRATTETLAGIIGGCESIETAPLDDVTGLPDRISQRLARNTQLILRAESHLDRVIDPAGGSWYVEALTNELAKKAWQLFQQVEALGGMAAAVQAGLPQEQIHATATQRLQDLATRREVLIGTNAYANPADELHPVRRKPEPQPGTPAPPPAGVRPTGTKDARATGAAFIDALIEAAAKSSAESLRALLAAAREATSCPPLRRQRAAEAFETLRRRAQDLFRKNGRCPAVCLLKWGDLATHKPRADFALNFFRLAGLEIIAPAGAATFAEAAAAGRSTNARIFALCAGKQACAALQPQAIRELRQGKPERIVFLCGQTSEDANRFAALGVDAVLHPGTNAIDVLTALLRRVEAEP